MIFTDIRYPFIVNGIKNELQIFLKVKVYIKKKRLHSPLTHWELLWGYMIHALSSVAVSLAATAVVGGDADMAGGVGGVRSGGEGGVVS